MDFLPGLVDGEQGGTLSDLWDGKMFSTPVPDLDALRIAKNDEINAERERRTFNSFEHAGKNISCDTLSRSDIDGINGYVALNGQFPDVWPGAWKCADNSYLLISSVDEWKSRDNYDARRPGSSIAASATSRGFTGYPVCVPPVARL